MRLGKHLAIHLIFIDTLTYIGHIFSLNILNHFKLTTPLLIIA